MSAISKAGMAAIVILQECENVGISATLRYHPDMGGVAHEPSWGIHATLEGRHHIATQFSDGDVRREGDWIRFAANTFSWIQRMLRGMSTTTTKEGR